MTTGRRHRANTAVQGCDSFLQHRNGGIGNTRINMTGAFQIEQSCGMVCAVKDIGSRLIDRHCPCAGHRVRLLPCMQTQRVKFQEIRLHPYSSPHWWTVLAGHSNAFSKGWKAQADRSNITPDTSSRRQYKRRLPVPRQPSFEIPAPVSNCSDLPVPPVQLASLGKDGSGPIPSGQQSYASNEGQCSIFYTKPRKTQNNTLSSP